MLSSGANDCSTVFASSCLLFSSSSMGMLPAWLCGGDISLTTFTSVTVPDGGGCAVFDCLVVPLPEEACEAREPCWLSITTFVPFE